MYDDLRKIFDDIRNNWGMIRNRAQFSSSKFFYKDLFVNELIYDRTFDKLPNTHFINYSNAYAYYQADRTKISLKRKDKNKELELPYKELINYVKTPDAKIEVDYSGNETFHLDDHLAEETELIFANFIKERPGTTNDEILSVKKFNKISSTKYKIKLVKASYFDSVRTNLSLDAPLKHNSFQTLRTKDLGENNNLKPFDESLLSNSIGVSTVLSYHDKGHFYFYLKPRKGNLGVFNDMLSSISGTIEPPANTITELTDFAAQEVIRELHEETGLSESDIKSNPSFQIIPLAFTRELTRGGKPQFFFLIMMNKISEKELQKIFKKSDGKKEFKADWINNIKSYDDLISPEFCTNLIYAYQHIQKEQKKDIEVIDLE